MTRSCWWNGCKPFWKHWSESRDGLPISPLQPIFYSSDAGIDRMDAICMILIAAGEELKNIDRKTEGNLLSRYPGVKWRGVMGVRDVLAHGYFQVNAEQLFDICQNDIPALIETVKTMIGDIEHPAV